MSSRKISQLESGAPALLLDLFVIARGNANYNLTLSDIISGGNIVTNGGTVSLAPGTVSSPSITTTGDPNTGLYFPTDDTIAVTTGGTERMRITSSGLEVSGTLIATGNAISFGGNDATNTIINVGGVPTGNKFAVTDYISDSTYTDFGLRVGRVNDGANGTSLLQHRGTGSMILDVFDAGSLVAKTSSIERMRITAAGSVVAGGSVALSTAATDGFLYVPTCAGTPTGTPTAITGMVPIVVNTTNNKLYFYSGGSWRDAGP